MNHTRDITLKALIVLLYGCSLSVLYAQLPMSNAEDASMASTSSDLAEIVLGDSEFTMPTQQALSVTLKGRGWTHSHGMADFSGQNSPLNLVIIEENADNTQFVFYRVLEGDDHLSFTRRDTENNLLYSYALKISWQENYVPDQPLILNDDFIEVSILNDTVDVYEQPFIDQENSTLLADTQNSSTLLPTSDSNTNTVTETRSTANDTSVSDEQENFSTESAQSATQAKTIDTLSNNLANDEAIDELALLADDRNTDNNFNIIEGLEATANNSDEAIQEKAVEELLFEEFKDYISKNWETKNFETLNSEILSWMEVNNDMFNKASIIWHYGKLLESKLTYASDIQRVYSMYKTIVNEYPLSLEYFQALEAIELLKQHYMFVLE